MIPTIESMLDSIILAEGENYTDDPSDKGGPTKYGITQLTLSNYRGHACSAQDVKELGKPEAMDIYRGKYLVASGLYKIKDPYVLSLAFDIAANHGPRRAVQWLQQIVGVVDDGDFGDQTEIAVESFEPTVLYKRLCAKRVRFYGDIIAHDPERVRATKDGYKLQAKYASGWADRAADFIEV